MISVHKLNGDEMLISVMQIAYLLVTGGPDTRIVLTDGSMIVVRELPSEVAERAEAALRRIFGLHGVRFA